MTKKCLFKIVFSAKRKDVYKMSFISSSFYSCFF